MDEATADFLEKMTNLYRHCDTYQDSGLIQSTTTTGDRTIKSHHSFRTFYARPGRLSMYFWFTEDQSGSAASIVYDGGNVYTFREDSGAPAHKCQSLSEALGLITTFCKWSTDGFVLAIPSLLESELRMSCATNFFDGCKLVQQLNSKTHLQKSEDSRVTDIWIRPDLTVHDVEVHSEITKEELIELHRQAMDLPEMKELLAKQKSSEIAEDIEEFLTDIFTKSRRVFSHVLFDQDIDDSVFEVPT